jgi:hypothetical protein
MLVGMALMLLAAIGTIGLIATLWFGFTATDEVVGRLELPLERIADDMATVRVVLERIEALLRGAPVLMDGRSSDLIVRRVLGIPQQWHADGRLSRRRSPRPSAR